MWDEIVLLKIDELVPAVNVTIIIFCGKYDMNNPTSLVKEYYEESDTSEGKEFILFEQSAHDIFQEGTRKI